MYSKLPTFHYSLFLLSAEGNLVLVDGMLKHSLAVFLSPGQLHRGLPMRVLNVKASSVLQEELEGLDVAFSGRKMKGSLETKIDVCVCAEIRTLDELI